MYSRLTTLYKNLSTVQRIEVFLFTLTVIVFTSVALYAGSIDAQSLVADRAPEYAYPVVHSDSEAYAQLAVRMLENRVFSTSEAPPYVPEINWAPGYPLLLAFSFMLFGSFVPVVVLQIFLGGVTTVIIFRIASQLVPLTFAIIPSLVFALDFSIAYYSSTVYTDGLFMSMVTVLTYFLFFSRQRPHSLVLFLSLGILLGAATLVRTIGQYLIVFIPVLYVGRTLFGREDSVRALREMVVFAVGAVIVITPWMIRNHDILGAYSIGNIGPKMFLQYYVKDFLTVQMHSETGTDFAQSDAAARVTNMLDEELSVLVKERGGTPESHFQELALRHIFDDPFAYGRFHIIGTLPYFLAGSYRHFSVSVIGQFKERAGLPYLQHENLAHKMTALLYSGNMHETLSALRSLSIVFIEIVWRALLILLGLLALCIPERSKKITLLIMWVLVCYFAFLTGPASLTRYRIVSEPLLLVLAGTGWWIVFTFIKTSIERLRFKRNHAS